MSENSTDVAQPATGTVAPYRRTYALMEYLQERAEATAGSRGNEVASQQIEKIIDATDKGSEDDVWNADDGDLVSGQDFAGVEFMFNGFDVSKSSDQYDATLGVFISIRCTVLQETDEFEIGEEVIVNTGAALVIAKARALEARGMLPAACVIKSIPSRKGAVLKLKPAPVRAQSGQAG